MANKPEHVNEIKNIGKKVRKSYDSWLESEKALQKEIRKYIAILKESTD